MGRVSCCEKTGLKKGSWTSEEDQILVNYIKKNGHGSWRALAKHAGLLRCGKSCRLRWTNYLKPDIKRGNFTQEEESTIIQLHGILGNRWSAITSQLPGRTDNEIKNFWNTRLKKRLLKMGIDPSTHAPVSTSSHESKALALSRHKAQWENARLEAEARHSRESLLMCSNSAAGYHTENTVEMITGPSYNPPTDYFLKIWNSEAGKVFRDESSGKIINESRDINSCHVFDQIHPNARGDDKVLYPYISKTPRSRSSVSSLCCASTQQSCDQSVNPNDKDKDISSQQCNSAPDGWRGEWNVKSPEVLSCFADMVMSETEHKAPAHVHGTEFSELLLDFLDHDKNNSSIDCMVTELTRSLQQQSAWPWPELHLEDDWNNVSVTAHTSAHS